MHRHAGRNEGAGQLSPRQPIQNGGAGVPPEVCNIPLGAAAVLEFDNRVIGSEQEEVAAARTLAEWLCGIRRATHRTP